MPHLHHLIARNRDLIIATTVSGITTFTMGAMQPVLPLYAQSLGAGSLTAFAAIRDRVKG